MFTSKKFWADVLERTVKTFAQTLAAILTADGVVDKIALEWPTYLLTAGIAAAVAFLMGVAGGQIGSPQTAAWLPAGPDNERG